VVNPGGPGTDERRLAADGFHTPVDRGDDEGVGRRKARSPDTHAIGIHVGSVLRERYWMSVVADLFPRFTLVARFARCHIRTSPPPMVEDHCGDAGCREDSGEVGDEVGDLTGPAVCHDDTRSRPCGARCGEEQATQDHAFCVEFDVCADVCHMSPPWSAAGLLLSRVTVVNHGRGHSGQT